jgi:hypothetical protein
VVRVNLRSLVRAAALSGLLTLAVPGLALAHIHQVVGQLDTEVGWLGHNSVQGQLARLDIRIADRRDARPVTGAEKTLKAELIYGDQRKAVDIMPIAPPVGPTEPGQYTTDPILLTQPGDYKVHLTGTVNGQPVDATYDLGSDPDMVVAKESDVAFPPLASSPAPASGSSGQPAAQTAGAPAAVPAATAQGAPSGAPAWASWLALVLGAVALLVSLLPRGRRTSP